jgi:hypothetical protein
MKYIPMALMTILVLLGTACSPANDEPDVPVSVEELTAPDEVDGPTVVPALVSVTPTPSPATPTEESTPMPTETDEATPAETGVPENEVAEPVTVDLSKLTPEPTVVSTPQEMPLPGGIDPVLDMTHAMRQDLARRLDIDISEIAVVRVEEVTWPDAGLGCPDPGFGYAQVLTPGFLAILETGGEEYTYHAANARNFVLCGADGAPVPTPAP